MVGHGDTADGGEGEAPAPPEGAEGDAPAPPEGEDGERPARMRPTAGEDRYFVVTQWVDEEYFVAWRDGQGRAAHSGERADPVSTGADLLEFEVVLDVSPAG